MGIGSFVSLIPMACVTTARCRAGYKATDSWRMAIANDAPAGRIDCLDDCVLTLAVPQPAGGGCVARWCSGDQSFGRRRGPGVSAAIQSEVAVLVARGSNEAKGFAGQRFLAAGGMAVPALNTSQPTFGVLGALQDRYAFTDIIDEAVFVEYRQQWFACLLGRGAGRRYLVSRDER